MLAGVILARAAAIYNDNEATQTNSHGAESRGGACMSDVVLSAEKIDYPICLSPDVLVCMSPESATRYIPTHERGRRPDSGRGPGPRCSGGQVLPA